MSIGIRSSSTTCSKIMRSADDLWWWPIIPALVTYAIIFLSAIKRKDKSKCDRSDEPSIKIQIP